MKIKNNEEINNNNMMVADRKQTRRDEGPSFGVAVEFGGRVAGEAKNNGVNYVQKSGIAT